MSLLKIGTRKSDLAKTQTRTVIKDLTGKGYPAQEQFIVTKGDVDKRPLNEISGDGFFTKEIEKALLNKEIQMAVHSSKDLPSMTHKYLPWVAFGEREQSTDILIKKKNHPLKTIGTSSPRRRSQLKQMFPSCDIVDMRGNVPTRIEKVSSGAVDAIVLAKAGVNRLQLQSKIQEMGLEIQELPFTTAPCQGILGVQGYFEFLPVLEKIMNYELTLIAHAEKCILALLGGGCHLSVGAHLKKTDMYTLDFFYDDEKKLHNYKIENTRLGDVIREAYVRTFSQKFTSRVWLTQPIQHQHKVAWELAKHDFEPVSWPLIDVQTVWDPKELETLSLDNYEGIIFSSQFAAQIFMLEWAYQSTDRIEAMKKIPIYAVGKATADILKDFKVIQPPEATSDSLVTILPLTKKPYLIPATPLTQMVNKLTAKKVPFKILPLYESQPSKSPLRIDTPQVKEGDKIVLTSPSAVEQFIVESKTNTALRSLQIFVIGPTTGRALDKYGIKHHVPETSGSWDSVIEKIKSI